MSHGLTGPSFCGWILVWAGALFVLRSIPAAHGADEPVMLDNGVIRIRLAPPPGSPSAYRGQRFNRGGIIERVELRGHGFFGHWRPDFQPHQHDAVTGPADEFDIDNPPGYASAEVGHPFIKIGVGVLRKAEATPYRFWTSYPEDDAGDWEVRVDKDLAIYTHRLRSSIGYGYTLEKTIRLLPGEPAFRMDYRLTNTGTRHLATVQYHHNFMVFDGVEQVGPGWHVQFSHAPEIREGKLEPRAMIQGSLFSFREVLEGKESFWVSLTGVDRPDQHRFVVEHRPTGRGIEAVGDRPVEKFNIYAQYRTVCPEPFVRIVVPVGETATWSVTYRFFTPELPLLERRPTPSGDRSNP